MPWPMTTARVEFNIPLANKVALDAAERGIRAATLEGQNILKADLLSRPGTGKLYQRGKTVEHRASAPGEPPAPDTGELRRRIEVDVLRGPTEVRGVITANVEYAAALELGTERMRARPFLSRLARDYSARLVMVFNRFAGG